MAQHPPRATRKDGTTIFTIGHSTRPIDEFVTMLKNFDVETLVDIRIIPRSRYNPQYEQKNLAASLRAAGIGYEYMKDLGGLRHAHKESINLGWRNSSFRGYADYMQTDAFENALHQLIELSTSRRVAIMCAEAVPWRCHRSLVGDALLAHGLKVDDIMDANKATPHDFTKFAHIEGHKVTYPSDDDQLRLL